ncbi:hypothetical protein QNK12_09955 [Neobacillus cucumis]|nr:hypothetical protein QNK12_09955 [Neobacillus cucumis]
MAISYISLALFDKDEHGLGLGIGGEIYHKVTQPDGSTYYDVYHIFSIYLDRNEFPSQRRAIHYTLSVVIPEVLEEDEAIILLSTLPHFHRVRALDRKFGIYAPGKELRFNRVKQIKHSTISLAIDAVERRHSITERL